MFNTFSHIAKNFKKKSINPTNPRLKNVVTVFNGRGT